MTALPAQPHTGGRQAALHAERNCTLIVTEVSVDRVIYTHLLAHTCYYGPQHIFGPFALGKIPSIFPDLHPLYDEKNNGNQ